MDPINRNIFVRRHETKTQAVIKHVLMEYLLPFVMLFLFCFTIGWVALS